MAGAKGATNGHYEVRAHPIAGLVSIVWCEPGLPPGLLVNLGEGVLPLLADAIAGYLNAKALDQAEASAADDLARRRERKGGS